MAPHGVHAGGRGLSDLGPTVERICRKRAPSHAREFASNFLLPGLDFDSGGHLAEFQNLLGGGGGEEVHEPGYHAPPNGPDNHFVATGNSSGWASSAATSTFTERSEQLVVN
jgi:hypothetical protein